MTNKYVLDELLIEGLDQEKLAELKREKEEGKGWKIVYGAYQNNKVLQAEVSSIETSNRIAYAVVYVEDVKGVIPADFFGVNNRRQMRNYLGRKVAFTIHSYDREQSVFVGDRLKAKEIMAELTMKRINVDDIVPLVIERVVPNGVYGDLGGISTFIPIDELRHGWIDNIYEEYKEGDHLLVRITDITEEEIVETNEEGNEVKKKKYKVDVSGKKAQKNPWDEGGIAYAFKRGTEHVGVVSGVQEYGVFVRLADGVDSLAGHLKFDSLKKGDEVSVRINDVDVEKEQIRSRITGIIKRN